MASFFVIASLRHCVIEIVIASFGLSVIGSFFLRFEGLRAGAGIFTDIEVVEVKIADMVVFSPQQKAAWKFRPDAEQVAVVDLGVGGARQHFGEFAQNRAPVGRSGGAVAFAGRPVQRVRADGFFGVFPVRNGAPRCARNKSSRFARVFRRAAYF